MPITPKQAMLKLQQAKNQKIKALVMQYLQKIDKALSSGFTEFDTHNMSLDIEDADDYNRVVNEIVDTYRRVNWEVLVEDSGKAAKKLIFRIKTKDE